MPILADYRQWEQYVKERTAQEVKKGSKMTPQAASAAPPVKKLSYAERKEMEQMEDLILTVEAQIKDFEAQAEDLTQAGISKAAELTAVCKRLSGAHDKLEKLFHRWQDLDSRM